MPFDAEYLKRLKEGDPETQRQFVEHFIRRLDVVLGRRTRGADDVPDLRQEVFRRVFSSLRDGAGVREPEKLPAYVWGTCKYVLAEWSRKPPNQPLPEGEIPDPVRYGDPQRELERARDVAFVRTVLDRLPRRDRGILRALFLEERDRGTVCEKFHVTPEYLRVLLHRAMNRFRAACERGGANTR